MHYLPIIATYTEADGTTHQVDALSGREDGRNVLVMHLTEDENVITLEGPGLHLVHATGESPAPQIDELRAYLADVIAEHTDEHGFWAYLEDDTTGNDDTETGEAAA